MGRVKKSILVLLFSLVLILVFSSFSFAATGVLDNTACANSGGVSLFLMSDDNNAHASSNPADAATYGYSVCYTGPSGVNTQQILRPSDANARQCIFSNEVVSLSSESNAHVESPSANTYDVPICYNHLECRVSDSGTVVANSGEQVLARLSADTDAHISIASDNSGKFQKYLICKEPVCNENAALPKVFPLISGFDSATENLGATAGAGAAFEISTAQKYTGASSLKLSYTMADLTAKSVTLNPGNKNSWSGYDYLEFYLYVEQTLGLSIIISADDGTSITVPVDNDVAPFGIVRGRWNLIQVPVDDLQSKLVTSISFNVNPIQTLNFITGASSTYVYYVDSMQLSSASATGDFAKYYCERKLNSQTGEPVYLWQPQLTQQLGIDPAGYSDWLSKIAPLATNTSSGKICGEQPGETYADGTTGCFNSIVVSNGTPIDFLLASDADVTQPLVCTGLTCRSYVSPQTVSGGFNVAELAPAGTNFVLGAYDVRLRTGVFTSGTTLPGSENIVSYSLVRPRVVYGSSMGFNSTGGVDSATSPAFYSCGAIPDQFSSAVTPVSLSGLSRGDACTVIGQYACSPSGFFLKQSGAQPVNAFVTESFNASETDVGCCPTNQCFGDGQCRPDQTNTPSSVSFGKTAADQNGFRCYAGEWKPAIQKLNYDGSQSGYCEESTQCLVTNSPTASRPGCIESGEYYQNYYCAEENDADGNKVGTWTSRTSILAAQMIQYAQNEEGWSRGTLYCDSYSKALNYVDATQNIANIFRGGPAGSKGICAAQELGQRDYPLNDNEYSCVNSFCVFAPESESEKPLFGTSLNLPFADVTDLNKAFADSCKDVANTDNFEQCGDSAYSYNGDLQLVMYNPNEQSIVAPLLTLWRTYIANPVRNLFSSNPSLDQRFVVAQESKTYSRFYFANTPKVSVTAFNEKRYNTTSATGKNVYVFKIETNGIQSINLCDDVVTPYNKKKGLTGLTGATCTQTKPAVDRTMTLIVGESDFDLESLWSSLTANLRIS